MLLANYYGQQFLTHEAFLHTHERINCVATAHPLDELNAFNTAAFQFVINNLCNRDSQRPILPFVNFPGYRTFSQNTTGALTGGVSTSLTLNGNGIVSLLYGQPNTYQIIGGVRLRFPSTGETVTVANTWSSSTPNTIPLTAAVTNSYAANAQVIIDPSFEDAAITSAANWLTAHFPGQSFGLEPTNEPTETDPTTIQKPFYLAVQAANVPTQFRVMGPCAVTQHSSNYLAGTLAPAGWQKTFGDNRGHRWVQQYSGHLYHHDCGDQSVLRSEGADIAAHKLTYHIGSQFIDTELGYRNTLNGLMVPMRQAEWLGQTLILAEQLGIPYQNLPYWNIYSHGDPNWNTGLFVGQSDQYVASYGPLPASLVLRNFKEQLFGTSAAVTAAINFANAGDMVFGNLYHRLAAGGTNSARGSDTIVLMSPNRDMSVTFRVKGGDGTLHTVDAYGNASMVTATGGQATVTGIGEPFFIQLENGQTATPLTGTNWGTNFAAASEGTTVTVTGGSTNNLSAIINGSLENYYSGTVPYTDLATNNTPAASSFPITFTFDMGQTRRISQVEIYCPAPFQSAGGTIFDWSWDYFNGRSWATLVPRQKRYPNQLAAFSSYAQGLVTDYGDHKYMFLDSFAPLSVQKFRLNVYAASNGGAMSQLAQEGGTDGAAFYPFVAISEVKARLVGGGLAATTGNLINLTGTNTGWTAGSPTFSVQKFPTNDLTVTSQSVTDSTHAAITVNPGPTLGYIVITDPTTGVKSVVRVGSNGRLNPGNGPTLVNGVNN